MNTKIEKKFRYDINGLRAYALILVILFHFSLLSAATGLFIGLDIFFVISGFLMTKIIISQLQNNRFSLNQFFLARAIRIIPALLVLTAVVAVIGWYLLIPEEYRTYAKHAALSIVFLSNVEYFREAGDYFAATTHEKILLHTWSLSVEWQFYILLPILLALVAKINNSLTTFKITIVASFIVSFVISLLVTEQQRIFSYFMLPTRAWEMLAGGIVYLFFNQLNLSNLQRKILEILGFTGIFISAWFFNSELLWPGYAALLPVIATMLILIANNQNSVLTRPQILQSLGDASYSIYLWHWPIVFFLGYLAIEKTPFTISLAIIASLVLGWFGYKLIEIPASKYLLKLNWLKCYVFFIVVITLLLAVYVYIFKTGGLPNRASPEYTAATQTLKMPLPEDGYCFYSVDSLSALKVGPQGLQCQIGSQQTDAKTALLFGDSYAGHNIPFWNQLGQQLNLNVNAITTNWCYPSFADNYSGPKSSRAYEQCLINREFFQNNVQKYDVIILAGSWLAVMSDAHQKDFVALIEQLKQHNKKVVLMAAPYTFEKHIGNSYKRAAWLDQTFSLEHDLQNTRQQAVVLAHEKIAALIAANPNMRLLSQTELFDASQLNAQGAPYSLDGGHLSIAGSLASAEYFRQNSTFKDFVKFIEK